MANNNKKDYYEILGVDKKADAETIKKAFRKLSIQYHPDKHVNDSETDKKIAEEKFKEIAEAYSVLSDENKRKQYDNYGFNSVPNGGGYDFGGFNINDLFKGYSTFSNFDDLFGGGEFYWNNNFEQQGWGGGRKSSAKSYDFSSNIKQGSDLRITLKLTLKEIVDGCEKKVKYKRFVKCNACDGTGSSDQIMDTCSMCNGHGKITTATNTPFGYMETTKTCPKCGGTGKIIRNRCKKCNGTGVIEKEETVTIKIPAGSIKNSVITLHGYGNSPRNGGGTNSYMGNLIVVIDEIPNDQFTHDGRNVYYNALLDLPTAILGGDIWIPLYDGSQKKVHIDAGIQPGSKITLEKQGLPINGSMYNIGDYIIQISVYIPEKLSGEEKKIFEKLKNSKNMIKK